MLQKKRDEFRKEIRKQQIDKMRQQKRKQLDSWIDNNEAVQVASIMDYLYKILQKHNQKSEQQAFQVKKQFVLLQNMRNVKPMIFTQYLKNITNSQKLSTLISQLIRNLQQSSQEDDDQPINPPKSKFSQEARQYILCELMKFLSCIEYELIHENAECIISSLWEILPEKIILSPRGNYIFLSQFLDVLIKILDTSNKNIYHMVANRGIGHQIFRILTEIKSLNLYLKIHEKILIAINRALNHQFRSPYLQKDSQFGGINLMTQKVHEKQVMLAYCLNFINKKQQNLYAEAFSCIRILCQIHEYLASCIKHVHLFQISDLINHPNRQIQYESLLLLNDLILHSQQNCDILMAKNIKQKPPACYLYDILYKRMMIQKNLHDNLVFQCLNNIGYIICNSLLSENKYIKDLAISDGIWTEIYNNIHPSYDLFPLIITFRYFFQAAGHKIIQKQFLRHYLSAVSCFEWKKCKFTEEIQKTIIRVFDMAQDYWQEHQVKKIIHIYEEAGFLYLIEDRIDREEFDQIKREEY